MIIVVLFSVKKFIFAYSFPNRNLPVWCEIANDLACNKYREFSGSKKTHPTSLNYPIHTEALKYKNAK